MNWRRLVGRLAGTPGSPRRTAAAFALGVFFSFSPFIGLQTAIGMTAAFLFRLSRVVVFIGLNANLPWIIVPWYTLTTLAGGWLLGRPIAPDFGERLDQLLKLSLLTTAFWTRAFELVAPYYWSFVVGSTLGAALLGIASYALMASALTRWRPAGNAQE